MDAIDAIDAVPGAIDDTIQRLWASIADLERYTRNKHEISQALLSVLKQTPTILCDLIAEYSTSTAFEVTKNVAINDQLYIVSLLLENIQQIQQSNSVAEIEEVVSAGSKKVMEGMPGISCHGCDNEFINPEHNEFVSLCVNCGSNF
jgi:hypothetical protein